jgi:hypothetical protein
VCMCTKIKLVTNLKLVLLDDLLLMEWTCQVSGGQTVDRPPPIAVCEC